MSYESRFYLVEKLPFNDFVFIGTKAYTYAVQLARINCSVVPEGLLKLFPSASGFYLFEGDVKVYQDMYGQDMTAASILDVFKFLNDYCLDNDWKNYRMLAPLHGFLAGCLLPVDGDEVSYKLSSRFEDCFLLHYGY